MARDVLRDALKRSTAALAAAGLPFALGGSYALWVHGAPEPDNDVDLVVTEADADPAARVLAAAGFEVTRTPEDWLFKAVRDDATVDVLHRLNARPVDAARLASASLADVFGVRVPVLPAQDVVTVKLLALTENYCDFAPLLTPVRAVREQLDWDEVRAAVDGNPYGAAFVHLTDLLGVSS